MTTGVGCGWAWQHALGRETHLFKHRPGGVLPPGGVYRCDKKHLPCFIQLLESAAKCYAVDFDVRHAAGTQSRRTVTHMSAVLPLMLHLMCICSFDQFARGMLETFQALALCSSHADMHECKVDHDQRGASCKS